MPSCVFGASSPSSLLPVVLESASREVQVSSGDPSRCSRCGSSDVARQDGVHGCYDCSSAVAVNAALAAGEGEARSVEGQVQQLLHDAQDPEKLCRKYIGWASWV